MTTSGIFGFADECLMKRSDLTNPFLVLKKVTDCEICLDQKCMVRKIKIGFVYPFKFTKNSPRDELRTLWRWTWINKIVSPSSTSYWIRRKSFRMLSLLSSISEFECRRISAQSFKYECLEFSPMASFVHVFSHMRLQFKFGVGRVRAVRTLPAETIRRRGRTQTEV